jgi:hypothetical protein
MWTATFLFALLSPIMSSACRNELTPMREERADLPPQDDFPVQFAT